MERTGLRHQKSGSAVCRFFDARAAALQRRDPERAFSFR